MATARLPRACVVGLRNRRLKSLQTLLIQGMSENMFKYVLSIQMINVRESLSMATPLGLARGWGEQERVPGSG